MTVEQKIEQFFDKYPTKTYDQGTTIVYAYDDPPGIMYIVEGQAIKYDISITGDKNILNSHKPGSFFPISWALNHTPNIYFIDAQKRCKIKIAPPEDVVTFLNENNDVAMELLSRVYRGTDGLLMKLAQLMGGDAHSRLIAELVIHSKRFGEKKEDKIIELEITETELSSRTGLSRETVSRELSKLKKDGAITTERGKVTVLNLEKLESEIY